MVATKWKISSEIWNNCNIYLFGYLLSLDPYSKDDKCLWDPKKVSGKDCKSFDKNTASRLDL